jgi:YD repeat-containing protein
MSEGQGTTTYRYPASGLGAGRLNELGTGTVGGLSGGRAQAPALVDSRTSNFVGYAETSVGTNVVPVVATDYSGNRRTNKYQIVVTGDDSTKSFTYDLNGNQIAETTSTSTNTYEWDAVNRLVKITQRPASGPEQVTEFTYDGLGRRVRMIEKTDNVVASDQRFLWVGAELAEEREANGATVTKRFLGLGEQVNGTNYYYTTDHLGSIRELRRRAEISVTTGLSSAAAGAPSVDRIVRRRAGR